MALTITHAKVSAVSDGADTSLVRPSDWNANHTVAGNEAAVAVHLTKSGNQTLTTAVDTALTFDTEVYDASGLHSTVSNTSRITIVTPGIYRFWATLTYASNATGFRRITFYKNGVSTILAAIVTANNGASTVMTSSTELSMAATDYCEVFGLQNSGGDLAITGALTFFGASLIGV